MTVDDLDWPLVALGRAGVEFRVVGPEELRERVAEWGARLGRAAAAG